MSADVDTSTAPTKCTLLSPHALRGSPECGPHRATRPLLALTASAGPYAERAGRRRTQRRQLRARKPQAQRARPHRLPTPSPSLATRCSPPTATPPDRSATHRSPRTPERRGTRRRREAAVTAKRGEEEGRGGENDGDPPQRGGEKQGRKGTGEGADNNSTDGSAHGGGKVEHTSPRHPKSTQKTR